ISTVSLPNGTVGAQYSAQLSATGGTAPYTWTVTGLPPGVTATGNAISGTPTQTGSFNVTASVTDSANATTSKTYAVTIDPAALVISTVSLPNGTVGAQYSAQLSATGGTAPYTWTVTGLPPGVTAAGNAISGTPTQAGSFNVTARVTDNAGGTTSRNYAVTVAPSAVLISTASLPNGTAGAPYSAQLNASGGTPPYTWSITGLPPGVAATPGGVMSGTPAQAGTFDVNARVTDSAGASVNRTYTVRIAPAPLVIANATLPDGAVETQYSAQLNASGGTPPYVWSITGLPPGLSATAAGAISGAPAQAGTFNVSARVSDAAGANTSTAYVVTIAGPGLTITTTSLPDGRAGSQYSVQLAATGGTPPRTWSVSGLPAGLTAAASGAIGGTPTAVGSFNVSARVTDSAGANVSRTWTLTISATPIEISACPVATTVAGQPYSSAAGATGGVVPYTWAVAAGQLPPGIGLTPITGAVSGIAAQQGEFNFSIRVTDAADSTAVRLCRITVSPALATAVQNLPGGVVRTPYAQRLTALGGVPPYRWSITDGALPPGLNLDAATGVISGTPQLAGRFAFRVRVTDQTGSFIEADVVINVATGLSVTACAGDTASTGRVYSSAFQASGGEPPYTWQLISGSVPAGLVLDTASGGITGTPQTPGAATFTVRVTDRPGTTATRECTIRIAPPLAITGTALAGGNVGVAYSERLAASGGVPPYTWTTVAGALAPGLFLNSGTGQITGTPTHPGDFAFTARVTDATGATRDAETSITITTAFRIADCPTPVAMLNQPYVYALAGVGGTAPYAWTVSAGALPAGLVLNGTTGVVAGTPARIESTDFTIRAVDAASSATTRACSLRIAPPSLAVNTARRLPDASLGQIYEAALTAAGGRPPYTWRVIDGAIPDGIALSTAGTLSGTPAAVGAFLFTVQVSDQDRNIANEVLELRVTPAALSAVRITGVPDIAAPAQQMFANLELERPYPAPITGTMRMRVTPDPGLPDDPAVQFAGGGRSVAFTIPAGQTAAVFTGGANGLQTGTVAASVQFEISMSAAGLELTPPQGVSTVMRVDRLAPRISAARANRTADGLELVISAFATTREITTATFRFTPAAGASFTQTEFTVDLREVAARWFADVRSWEFGSQFTLVQPFRISGAAVSSVAMTLTNGQGTSQAVTVRIE
ncbi:MAG TPA: putative Ig domain-containing protein, partial [Bryobacteraceae bacterium]|nr:putative Ig domain-containing protein [Bryobacteraceae bacterium]